jgi:hypothetical protein
MPHVFEKESLFLDWFPVAVLLFLVVVCVWTAVSAEKPSLTITSSLMAVGFLVFPVLTVSYFLSFNSVEVKENTITIVRKQDRLDFTIPDDLGRVKIDADDLGIELKNAKHRFVLRTRHLKDKMDFIVLFSRMIKQYPPRKDRVILNNSVLEIMERLKKH